MANRQIDQHLVEASEIKESWKCSTRGSALDRKEVMVRQWDE